MKINIDAPAENDGDLNNFKVYFQSHDSYIGTISVSNNIFHPYVEVENSAGDGMNIDIKDFTKFVKIVTMMEAKLKELGKIE